MADLAVQRLNPRKLLFSSDDDRTFTYGDFWNLTAQLAHVLHFAGVKSGDRVAVQVSKSVEAIALFWACARSGCIFLPLNSAYTPAEVSYFVDDAQPAALICDPAREEIYSAMFCSGKSLSLLTLDDAGQGSLCVLARQQSDEFVSPPMDWDTTAAILYTSGTTGRSKGAMLTHGNLASNALALVDSWGFTARDRLIHALPVYHTHGLFTATNTVMFSGGDMLFRRSFDANDVVSLFAHATVLMGVPTFYTRLLKCAHLTRESVASMRLFISGSAPLLAETHREFEALTGHAILERYGMTETSMNTSNPLHGKRRAGTVGTPLPHVMVRISGLANGGLLPSGETGMIELNGPNLFKGYWRNPEKTAEDMTADGYFRTGDIGRFDDEGHLVITGRAKDLIITGGFNVYPKEIEALLDELSGVHESAVIGIAHRDFGEAVTAIVVMKPGFDLDEDTIVATLQPILAKFKIPKRVIVVEALPRNAMGKVQKAVLRETFKDLYLPV
jgi:malonyl-CoA/methylmalonyl-CoA synthetase